MEYMIAAIAVALSVLALLDVRQAERRMDRIYDALEVTQRWISGHGDQIAELRTQFEDQYQEGYETGHADGWQEAHDLSLNPPDDLPPVHRTTSKPRPEVRNIHPHHDNFAGDPTPDRSGP